MVDRPDPGERRDEMKNARGFTLIEILVALTMFAVVGGALLQLFQGGLRAARQASDYGHAVLLARSKFTEIQALRNLRPGRLEGDFGDGYQWQAVLKERSDTESDPAGPLRALDLLLTVHWGEAGRNAFELHSIAIAPAED